MEKTFEGWDKDEWGRWVAKLDKLSLPQLQALTEAVGISFGDRKPQSKEAYILVLDESDPSLLAEKYDQITNT